MSTSFTVFFFLALFNFLASIIQGLTGFGDAVILHVMWYTASVISPEIFNTTPLGSEPVRAITILMYIRIIFSAPLVAILSFKDGIFSKTMTIAMAIPSTLTAICGVYLFANMNGEQLKLVLGLSCLMFAILYCMILVSRYAMKQRRVRLLLARVCGYCAPILSKFKIFRKNNTQFSHDDNEEPTIITTIEEEEMQPSKRINNMQHTTRSLSSRVNVYSSNNNINNSNTSHPLECKTFNKLDQSREEHMERKYKEEMLKLSPDVVMNAVQDIPNGNNKTATDTREVHAQDNININSQNDSEQNKQEEYEYTRKLVDDDDSNSTKNSELTTSVDALRNAPIETDKLKEQQIQQQVENETLQKPEQEMHISYAHVEFSQPSPNSAIHVTREEKPNDVAYSIVHPTETTAITGITDVLRTTCNSTYNNTRRDDCTLESECGSPFTLHEAHTPVVVEATQPIPPLTPSKLSPTRSMMYTRVRINRNLDESGKIKRTTKVGASFAAALSGIMGSLTGVGAPPQIIFVLLFDVPQYIIRVNFCIQSIPSAAFRFIVACTTPLFTWTMVPMFIVAILFGYAGIFFGNYLGKMMGPKGYNVFVLSLLLVASLIMMTTNVAVLIISTLLCVCVSVIATWWEWRETHRQVHNAAESVTIISGTNNTLTESNNNNINGVSEGDSNPHHPISSSVITIHDDNYHVQHNLEENHINPYLDINLRNKVEKREQVRNNTPEQTSLLLITPLSLQTQPTRVAVNNSNDDDNDNNDSSNTNVSTVPRDYSVNHSFNYSNENASFYSNDTNSHKPRRVRRAELHRPPSLFLESENNNETPLSSSESLTSQATTSKKRAPVSLLKKDNAVKRKETHVNLTNAHSKHHTKEKSNTGHDDNINSDE